jgi:hypothetical protein
MQESIRLKNVGTELFSHVYGNEVVAIEPGSEKFVPFDVMVAFMGHPNVRNNEYERWRDESYNNLCLFYGAQTIDGIDSDVLPQLEAWDSDGNRISTILDDPAGDNLQVDAAPHTDTAIMAQQIAEMKAAMETAGITVPDPAPVSLPAGPITDEMPPADKPVKVKVGPAR